MHNIITASQGSVMYNSFGSLLFLLYKWICVSALIALVVLGASFTFIFPAFQVADEDMHWFTANARYEKIMQFVGVRSQAVCGQAQSLSQKFDVNSLKSNTVNKVIPGELERAGQIPAPCPPISLVDRSSIFSYPGVLVGRIFVHGENDSPNSALISFYLSRLAQGSVLVAVFMRLIWLLFANRNGVGFGVLSLLLFCLSPMVVNQSFGISYDMILVAATTFGVGLLLFHSSLKPLDMVALILMMWGAVCGKPVFLPIALSLLVSLGAMIYLDRKSVRYFRANLGLILASIPALCLMALMISASEVDGAEQAMTWRPNIDPNYNLNFLLSDPLRGIKVLWNSSWSYLYLGWMSSPLGWTNVNVKLSNQEYWIGLLRSAFLIDLLGSLTVFLRGVFSKNRATVIQGWLRTVILGLLIVLAAGAFMTMCSLAMYLVWTPKDSLSVQGLQHRYFLPVYLTAIGAAALISGGLTGIKDQHLVIQRTKAMSYAIVFGVVIFSLFLAKHVVAVSIDVLERFY